MALKIIVSIAKSIQDLTVIKIIRIVVQIRSRDIDCYSQEHLPSHTAKKPITSKFHPANIFKKH